MKNDDTKRRSEESAEQEDDSRRNDADVRDSLAGASNKSKCWDSGEISKVPALGAKFRVGSCVQFVPEGIEFWEFWRRYIFGFRFFGEDVALVSRWSVASRRSNVFCRLSRGSETFTVPTAPAHDASDSRDGPMHTSAPFHPALGENFKEQSESSAPCNETVRSTIISNNRAKVLLRVTLDNTQDRTEL